MKRSSLLGLIACALFLLGACRSTKDITYFQPISPEYDEQTLLALEPYIPLIKEGDILSIIVSSLDKDATAMFNPVPENRGAVQTTGSTAPNPVVGFLVDDNGNITLPLVGTVYVKGKTSKTLAAELMQTLNEYLESPTVFVRIANYQITLLGEVARPSVYTIPNEMITLPQALAMAGDLTIYGKRKNILIIREELGNRTYARVNVADRSIFDSPYYYLRAGDVVYVESTPGKLTSTDRVYQLTPILISSLSFLVLIFNNFVK
jgi:Periplasmic protein involved in polysaccharide export